MVGVCSWVSRGVAGGFSGALPCRVLPEVFERGCGGSAGDAGQGDQFGDGGQLAVAGGVLPGQGPCAVGGRCSRDLPAARLVITRWVFNGLYDGVFNRVFSVQWGVQSPYNRAR